MHNRRYMQLAVRDVQTDDGLTRFVASTDNEARDGLVIERNAWRIDNFKRNPVFLWAHDYRQLPIGKVEEIGVGERGLEIGVRWREAPFAQEVAAAYRDGFLNAVSVGWDTIEREGNRIKSADLLEVSGVPVPADADALEASRAAGGLAVEQIDQWAREWLGDPDVYATLDQLAEIARMQHETAERLAEVLERIDEEQDETQEPDAGETEPPRVVLLISE